MPTYNRAYLSSRLLQVEGQLTLPVTQAECRQCCDQAEDNDKSRDFCKDLGCENFEECEENVDSTGSCNDGRDFLLTGAARINSVNLRCIGGNAVEFEGFDNVVDKEVVNADDVTDCQNCCDEINDQLDNDLGIFSVNDCRNACQGQTNCFDEGDSKDHMACFIGSDLITVGESFFKSSEDEIQVVSCPAGELIIGEQVVGDNDEAENVNNNNENGDLTAFIAIAVTVLVVLPFLAMIVSRRKKKKAFPNGLEQENNQRNQNQNTNRQTPMVGVFRTFTNLNWRNRGSVNIDIPGLGGVVSENPAERSNRQRDDFDENGRRKPSGLAPPGRSVVISRPGTWLNRTSTTTGTDSSNAGSQIPIARKSKKFLPFNVGKNRRGRNIPLADVVHTVDPNNEEVFVVKTFSVEGDSTVP